jgi:hypothetical protein
MAVFSSRSTGDGGISPVSMPGTYETANWLSATFVPFSVIGRGDRTSGHLMRSTYDAEKLDRT